MRSICVTEVRRSAASSAGPFVEHPQERRGRPPVADRHLLVDGRAGHLRQEALGGPSDEALEVDDTMPDGHRVHTVASADLGPRPPRRWTGAAGTARPSGRCPVPGRTRGAPSTMPRSCDRLRRVTRPRYPNRFERADSSRWTQRSWPPSAANRTLPLAM